MTQTDRRRTSSRGSRLLAAALVVLGVGTGIANLAALATVGTGFDVLHQLMAVAYSAAAIVAGAALWRGMNVARAAYVVWGTSIVFFALTDPGGFDPYLIPGYTALAAALVAGYAYVARNSD